MPSFLPGHLESIVDPWELKLFELLALVGTLKLPVEELILLVV